MVDDLRNLIDEFKGLDEADITARLDRNSVQLQIALDNVVRDFNMGTIVRSANAFGVRTVHIIGRRQWNKRGAMATDHYLHIRYWTDSARFVEFCRDSGLELVAVDNTLAAQNLAGVKLKRATVMLFGSESGGVRQELLEQADKVVKIEQFGSTRSLNVGVAAGVAMYDWVRRWQLPIDKA